MTIPCDCCPLGLTSCYQQVERQQMFSTVAVIANPQARPFANQARIIDNITADSTLIGFAPPSTDAQLVGAEFGLAFATPQRVSRLDWFNGGGGDLTDGDGFGMIMVELVGSSGAVLFSFGWNLTPPVNNNNVARTRTFPPVDNVAVVRFSNLTKQSAIMGTGSPLLREVRAFTRPLGTAFGLSCDGVVEWYDTDGELVDPADLIACTTPPPPITCDLVDPASINWTDNGNGTWSKDLGQDFVITARIPAGSFTASFNAFPNCAPIGPLHMLGFLSNAGSYPVGSPAIVEFTATKPWPAPFAVRVFDIDGNSNTAKHVTPNETVHPSWGIPDSVEGLHPATYRDKGLGEIGANGAPADGRDFTLVYDNPPPFGPLEFRWHGSCIGFDFAIPDGCP